jgi:hypothetical protein
VVLLAPDGIDASAPSTSIRAVVDTPYAALAAALGWEDGVPGTQVRVHRMEEPHDESYWTVAPTDSTGIATFADLLVGLYEVTATRALTVAETARAQRAVLLLAGGSRMYLPSASVEELQL